MFSLHVYLCTVYMQCPQRPKKGTGSPRRAGATEGCELPCQCWELNPDPKHCTISPVPSDLPSLDTRRNQFQAFPEGTDPTLAREKPPPRFPRVNVQQDLWSIAASNEDTSNDVYAISGPNWPATGLNTAVRTEPRMATMPRTLRKPLSIRRNDSENKHIDSCPAGQGGRWARVPAIILLPITPLFSKPLVKDVASSWHFLTILQKSFSSPSCSAFPSPPKESSSQSEAYR